MRRAATACLAPLLRTTRVRRLASQPQLPTLFRLSSTIASPADFHVAADRTLISLETALCAGLEDAVPELDCVHSMGVLTIALGSRGTIVINKQAPNQQLWWSSPLSGPLRFRLSDGEPQQWICTRNGVALLGLLEKEVKSLTGVTVKLTSEN